MERDGGLLVTSVTRAHVTGSIMTQATYKYLWAYDRAFFYKRLWPFATARFLHQSPVSFIPIKPFSRIHIPDHCMCRMVTHPNRDSPLCCLTSGISRELAFETIRLFAPHFKRFTNTTECGPKCLAHDNGFHATANLNRQLISDRV